MDADNALASCKAIIDGIAAAGIVANDKQCRFTPVEQVRDPAGRGYVRVQMTEADA